MTDNTYRRTIIIGVIRVAANAITLGAVFLAMYQSFNHPAEPVTSFCSWFFGITVVTWIAARCGITWTRRRLADGDEGMVRLPGSRRSCLVRWKVCAASALPERVRAGSL